MGITRLPINTLTFPCGNIKMYAPSTPAIAPEAPKLGMFESGAESQLRGGCRKAADEIEER